MHIPVANHAGEWWHLPTFRVLNGDDIQMSDDEDSIELGLGSAPLVEQAEVTHDAAPQFLMNCWERCLQIPMQL